MVLPSFRADAGEALTAAEQADELGVDGIFCFDHVWPLGQPERPAIAPFPLLAAIAGRTRSVSVGTLVARVGLVPNDVLVSQFDALELLAPGRVMAALGTGDHLSAPENLAYGVAFEEAEVRREDLVVVGRALRERGMTVWVGGGHPGTLAVAEAEGLAVNLWNAGADKVGAQAQRGEVTWAGNVPDPIRRPQAPTLAGLVAELDRAGATWAVFAWPVPLRELVEAAAALAPRP